MSRKKCCCEESVHRQFCRTAHKRRQQYSHLSITLGRQRSAGHDSRDSTSETYKHRNYASPGQTYLPKKLVHDKCNSGHIATVLQQRQEKKQRDYYRQKAEYAPYSVENTIYYQRMYYVIHTGSCQQQIHGFGQRCYSFVQPVRQNRAYYVESQPEYGSHYTDESRYSCIFPCKYPVYPATSQVFPALLRFYHGGLADLHYESESHISNCCSSVKPALLLHLEYYMIEHLPLIIAEPQCFDY